MSAEVVTFPAMTEEQAEKVTEQIAYRIDSITENYEVVMSLMRDALARNAHAALGYASPGAYIADRFGQSLQTLGVALRREFVHELSDAGLSTRAIAPVFGVTHKTIVKDRQVVPPVPPERETFTIEQGGGFHEPGERIETDTHITVDARTGEVLDEPTVTEHTVTEKVKTTVGLDGKTYKRAEPVAPRRRSLVDDAMKARHDLWAAVSQIQTVMQDDRYKQNKADIQDALHPAIRLANEVFANLFDTKESEQI